MKLPRSHFKFIYSGPSPAKRARPQSSVQDVQPRLGRVFRADLSHRPCTDNTFRGPYHRT